MRRYAKRIWLFLDDVDWVISPTIPTHLVERLPNISHEFQTITPTGEDRVFVCEGCFIAINQEVRAGMPQCPECGAGAFTEHKAIEVGNIFKLMYRFSDAFEVMYSDPQNAQQHVPMGCYGLGTSHSWEPLLKHSNDEKGIVWPLDIAPFSVHLISLGRKPETVARAHELYEKLTHEGFDVLFDEREVVPQVRSLQMQILSVFLRDWCLVRRLRKRTLLNIRNVPTWKPR